MFICNDCDHYFDEPGARTEKETFEYWGANITDYADYECCPRCGSYEFEKATACGLCDEPVYQVDKPTPHKFEYCKYHLDAINEAMNVAVHTVEESSDVGKSREDVIQAIGYWLEEKGGLNMDKNYFEVLNAINVNDKTEKKNNLTYLSWAWAWAEIKKLHPDAIYTIYENAEGWFYHTDGKTAWVKTGVTIEGIEHIEYLPVMDFRNKSIPFDAVTSFDVNKAIQRSLTKAVARHGLGLYIYAGEDLPEEESGENPKKVDTPAEAEKEAYDIKTRLINNVQVKSIEAELRRTGVKPLQITSQYKVKTLGELNFEQWKEIMTRLEVTPDKPKKDLGL